jgi:hypothetical protein
MPVSGPAGGGGFNADIFADSGHPRRLVGAGGGAGGPVRAPISLTIRDRVRTIVPPHRTTHSDPREEHCELPGIGARRIDSRDLFRNAAAPASRYQQASSPAGGSVAERAR